MGNYLYSRKLFASIDELYFYWKIEELDVKMACSSTSHSLDNFNEFLLHPNDVRPLKSFES